jgi:hypothetical protein
VTKLYDSEGLPAGGLVDKAQDADKQALLKAEDEQLMQIVMDAIEQHKTNLCRKCGHPVDLHRLEVEATICDIEKYNETAAATECEAREDNRYCGCRYVL